ncbi:MAG: type II secretion system GspH family protein, partial [Candidatus Gastranaerophilales bacterium]|nr:type II secretion system GspH family protein [Candidatus Gastranaerophilales bacterium]
KICGAFTLEKTLRKHHAKAAFTLAETLITLAIIGVVAAMTIPAVLNHGKRVGYRTAAFKAMSTLNDAIILYRSEYGEPAKCAYWDTNPYSSTGTCTAQCTGYTEEGNCQGHTCKETGGSLPSDYSGNFGDCKKLFDFFTENLNITKYCTSDAYENGCIPYYGGNDTVYLSKNPSADSVAVNKSTSGCAGFRQSNILSRRAFVTNDGLIYVPYSYFTPIFIVDTNGFAGPNRFGYDLIFLTFKAKLGDDPKVFTGGCEIVESGGITTSKLLYNR